jgi:hypothetical protein
MLTMIDEYKIKVQIRDLTFFAWVQAIVLAVVAFVALPVSCDPSGGSQCNHDKASQEWRNRPRRPERQAGNRESSPPRPGNPDMMPMR